MTRTDAQIAREWAEKISIREKITFSVDNETLAAARHILATTTAPTMADVEWDDEVHAGLCAEHLTYGIVRMLEGDSHGDILFLYVEEGRLRTRWTVPNKLTPLPGTRVDLTPRRDPESTPDHPTVLTIEADYRKAPTGTIVATEGAEAWTKDLDGLWETWGIIGGYTNYAMADTPRRVLRWGWKA